MTLVEQAITYAARAWAVLPLWWPQADGPKRCACQRAQCQTCEARTVGLFISRRMSTAPIEAELTNALLKQPLSVTEAERLAQQRAAQVAAQATAAGDTTFHSGRFLVAVGMSFLLFVIALIGDATKLIDPKTPYAMATTVLGIIAGFLGGEGTAAVSSNREGR